MGMMGAMVVCWCLNGGHVSFLAVCLSVWLSDASQRAEGTFAVPRGLT